MRLVRAIPVVALLVAAAVPAWADEADPTEPSCRVIRGAETPDDPTDDVSVCRQDVWFHQGTTKAGNAAAVGQGAFPSWDTTKPTASVATGAGGGYLASSALHQGGSPWDERASATFKGTYTGDIDTLAVTLYLFPPVEMVRGEPFTTSVRILVDDKQIFDGGADMPLKPGGQAARKVDFAITNLYGLLEQEGVNGPAEHKVTLQFHGAGLATEAAVFVYDTSEVPAGAVFNIEPESITAEYTVIDAGG